ncbi:MAG: hypothetical protein II956_02710 [Bacteroidales bacterium]|nr:hypothetical protein [Bacteroidales bacterium]
MIEREEEWENRENEENENEEENQSLNEAYDKVSALGVPPSLPDGYFSSDTPYGGNSEIGNEVGDIKLSGEVFSAEGFSFGGQSEEEKKSEEEPSAEQDDGSLTLKSVLDGTIFAKNMVKLLPYLGFIGFLFVLYISNRNIAESVIRRNIVLKREVREYRAEAIIKAAELMNISKETEVSSRIEKKQLGIFVQQTPPPIFYIDKFQRADSLKTDGDSNNSQKQ